MAILTKRELEICARLRVFREATKIARSRFALAIGITNDRLASYEFGRAPLRYEVFRAINKQFYLNPLWLAGEDTSANAGKSFDDSAVLPLIKPRALFSQVYDNHLAKLLEPDRVEAEQYMEALGNFSKFALSDDGTKFFAEHREALPEIRKRLQSAIQFLDEGLEFAEKIKKAKQKKPKRRDRK